MLTLPDCCYPGPDASPAERAYCAYNAAGDPATAGLNFRGDPCPTWRALPENVRAKWEGAVAPIVAPDPYVFALKQPVALSLSGEAGIVIGRAEYSNESPSYRVRYVDATGRQQCEWFSADSICAISPPTVPSV
jgi:hypothetical protein